MISLGLFYMLKKKQSVQSMLMQQLWEFVTSFQSVLQTPQWSEALFFAKKVLLAW